MGSAHAGGYTPPSRGGAKFPWDPARTAGSRFAPTAPSALGAPRGTSYRRLMLLPDVFIRLRRPLILGLHLVLIPLGYYAAFALRFDFRIPPEQLRFFWNTLPYLLVLRLGAFAAFGLFHGWWRHVGMSDLVNLVEAVTASSLLFTVALFMAAEVAGFPPSIVVLAWARGR